MGNGFRSFNFFLIFLLIFKFNGGYARDLPRRNDPNNNNRTSHHDGDDQMPQHHTATTMDADHHHQHDAIEVNVKNGRIKHYRPHRTTSSSSHIDDLNSSHIFFHIADLNNGTKLPLYFPIRTPSSSSSPPKILPKNIADTIPFTSSQLPYLLHFFSFSNSSPQAKAMEQTLKHCEFPSTKQETKFCATSLESMLDKTREIFDPNHLKVMTTTFVSTNLIGGTSLLEEYTIMEDPKEILISKMMGCHPLPYPYKVYYCHGQKGDTKVFRILLKSQSGNVIDAVGICHMDTSKWDENHVAFRVLGVKPGKSPVCHVFPPDNLVWIEPSRTSMGSAASVE